VPGYDVAATCSPSGAVGGDFYDWHPAASGLRFTLADVMGKGIPAAIMMATVRAVLRATAAIEDVTTTVRHAAETLDPDLDATGTLVTLVHGTLRAEDGHVSYADAGHGLLLAIRADGEAERLASDNVPFGVPAQERWETGEVRLEPGDTLVAFSDGVLDLYDGTLAAVDDFAALVAASGDARDVVRRVAARAREVSTRDDVTLVVIRRRA